MRTTFAEATVRLYHLDSETAGGGATTLFYGPLSEAMIHAAAQTAEIQQDLWLATDNDVVSWLDLAAD